MALKMNETYHHEEETPLDVFNYNVKRLQDATTQTSIIVSDDLLQACDKTIHDFQTAVGRPHQLHRMDHLSAHAVAVNATEEQFREAIRYYSTQETTKACAQFKQFRKGWNRMAGANNGRAGMGFFMFLIAPMGMTVEEFMASLKPAPKFHDVVEYIHPSGLVDKILLMSTTTDLMDELKFKAMLSHISKVHELEGRVHSVADPEQQGRAQIRVPYLLPDVEDDNQLPWAGAHVLSNSVLANGQSHFPTPLVGSTVRVYLTYNNEGGYIMTYGAMILDKKDDANAG